MPKVGFSNPYTFYLNRLIKTFFASNRKEYTEINLDRLQHLLDTGRLDATKPITIKSFIDAGITDIHDGIKILGGGKAHFNIPIEIHATRFTKSAIEAIEQAGGKPVAVYHDQEALRQLKNPQRFARKHPELAAHKFSPPNTIKERLFYSLPKNRGYLAMEMSEEFRKHYEMAEPLTFPARASIPTPDTYDK